MNSPEDLHFEDIPEWAFDEVPSLPDPTISQFDAAELARHLGADQVNVDGDGRLHIDHSFVTSTLELRQADRFMVEYEDHDPTYHQVAEDTNFTVGFKVAPIDAGPGDMEYHRAGDWDECGPGYGVLWLAWLRGNVIPLRTETVYYRRDTGEEVDI